MPQGHVSGSNRAKQLQGKERRTLAMPQGWVRRAGLGTHRVTRLVTDLLKDFVLRPARLNFLHGEEPSGAQGQAVVRPTDGFGVAIFARQMTWFCTHSSCRNNGSQRYPASAP
jgi:hypothetical protein